MSRAMRMWLSTRIEVANSWKLLELISFDTGSMHTKFWNNCSSQSGDIRMSTIFTTSEYPKIVDKCDKMRKYEKMVLQLI